MDTLLTIVHVLVCLLLVGIVLLQHGKGADIGASFGGSSQSLFGSEGPIPLLNKITTGVAIIFMVTSVSLAYISAHRSTGSVMQELQQEQTVEEQQQSQEIKEIPMPDAEGNAPSEAGEQTDTPTQ
ncbi:preprotein translocase subunit SecG [Desulfopila inferna]|uniref:preprotein translocase subunit SecG n=1 Tax=Desulfopila inferna TaxID=468528 RepID=UPI00196544A1|nr:preprotein translocase subunit SecG [Desulfopila inferna]MBM9606231.1 preprotein translocase subunit SecG [Desulfopila inferna]